MVLFLKVFLTEFIAEMGDKTQLMLIALTSKYKLKDIILGTAAAILVLNGMAVLAGGLVSEFIPDWLIKTIAALAFLYFAAVEETEIVEEAAAEETAEEVTEETEETESAEPETVEEIEEFEETIEEPEEEPEPEPSEPIELAMPVYTAEELLQKAHAAGDDPKVIEDPATGITILDYSDIL